MSYTGTGANAQEHPILQGVEQGRVPSGVCYQGHVYRECHATAGTTV